jgi:alpha-tubulin suppressor-like RCC1 family protein
MRAAGLFALALIACRETTSMNSGPGSRFVTLSSGMYHTCALDKWGNAFCWGRNVYGALGDGTFTNRATPARVAIDVTFTALTAGWDYTCGLLANGGAYCWGANFAGQLGDGTTGRRNTPVFVAGGLTFSEITAGEAHTCGITTAGDTYCWGAPLSPAPDGTLPPFQTVPTRLDPRHMTSVSSGYEIACGIGRTRALYCWGLSPPGVTFDSAGPLMSATPRLVTSSTALVRLSAGFKHACGVDQFGQVLCWGQNRNGEVGDSTSTDASGPTVISGPDRYHSVSAHSIGHTCAVTIDGAGRCWGNNRSGQLGNLNVAATSTVPVSVAGARRWTVISTGGFHTCGITVDDKTLCWGSGAFGQLGGGEWAGVREPTATH